MIRSQSAFTRELDDPVLAAQEILGQIDIGGLGAHSVGIVFCEQEFIENGIVKAICTRLPFETVGGSTNFSSLSGDFDAQQFNLLILTSDDVSFVTAISDSFGAAHETCLDSFRTTITTRIDGKPDLVFAFAPMLFGGAVDNEKLVKILSDIVGDVPMFGTFSCNYRDGAYCDTRVIHNGECCNDRAVLLLIRGMVRPRFAMARMPESHILKRRAIITKSEGNFLIEVNDKPVVEYLDGLGLLMNGQLIGGHSFPFVIDDGTGKATVSRVIYGITPEGHVHCGGEMYEGSTISIGAQDVAAVLRTAKTIADAGREDGGVKVGLFFSCHSRSATLGVNQDAEAGLFRDELGDAFPYVFMYSGGEICPYVLGPGEYRNSFHSDTIVACFL